MKKGISKGISSIFHENFNSYKLILIFLWFVYCDMDVLSYFYFMLFFFYWEISINPVGDEENCLSWKCPWNYFGILCLLRTKTIFKLWNSNQWSFAINHWGFCLLYLEAPKYVFNWPPFLFDDVAYPPTKKITLKLFFIVITCHEDLYSLLIFFLKNKLSLLHLHQFSACSLVNVHIFLFSSFHEHALPVFPFGRFSDKK